MDIGKSFTYVMDDPNWIKKVLIGGVLLFIPIVNFAVIGFALVTMKNVADGNPTPMPEWGDFGNFFMKGLYAAVGAFIWFAPAILLACCNFILSFAISMALGAGGQGGGDAVAGLASIVGFLTLCISCVQYLLMFVSGVTVWAPLTRFAMTENQLAVFWDFRGSLDLITQNLGAYIMALVVGYVAYIVAAFGIILCCIGYLFTLFWGYMVNAYLFGQFWRNRQGGGMLPAPAMA